MIIRLLLIFILSSIFLRADKPSFASKSIIIEKKEYKNCTITLSTPSEATILHSSGVKRVPASYLPENIKKELGFDPEKSKNYKLKEKQKIKRAIAYKKKLKDKKNELAKSSKRKLWVESNLKEGLIVGSFITVTNGGRGRGIGIGPKTGPGYKYQKRTYNYIFLKHTSTTQKFPVDHVFTANILKSGSKRISQNTVLDSYKIILISKSLNE